MNANINTNIDNTAEQVNTNMLNHHTDKKNVKVNIGGISLEFVVTNEDEAVLMKEAASYVDKDINDRRQKQAIVKPLDFTAVVVALSVTLKLLAAQKTIENGIQEKMHEQLEGLNKEIQGLNVYADEVLSNLRS
jgi:Cell division protein ZapA